MSRVTIRPFNKDTDQALIYSTWSNGVYYSVPERRKWSEVQKSNWFEPFCRIISNYLDEAKIYVACMEDNESTILGYSVIYKDVLEWIYVKELFRNQGLGTFLTQNKGITSVNHTNITRCAENILENHPHLFEEEKEEHHENPSQSPTESI